MISEHDNKMQEEPGTTEGDSGQSDAQEDITCLPQQSLELDSYGN